MKQSVAHIALVVKNYDEAIDFFTKKLDFSVVEDTYQPELEPIDREIHRVFT